MAAIATCAEKPTIKKSPRPRPRPLPIAPLKQYHRIKQASSPSQIKKLTKSGGSVLTKSTSPARGAFASGLGLEIVEVDRPATFQVFCPPNTQAEDLEIDVSGPSGSKSVEIQDYGNGQFLCLYTPVVAVQHTVSVKVKGHHVPGSPFTANVQFANYTDECSAEGPGLLSGVTDTPCRFTIRCNAVTDCERLHVRVFGPSRAEPIELTENPNGGSVDVVYHPTATGEYVIRVTLGEAQVRGSPFHVPVTKAIRNDPRKVKVSGSGLNGGNINELIKIFVKGEPGAGPGPLGVRMVGPSTPVITSDDSSGEGVEVAFRCCDPGEYQLFLMWDNKDLPNSPYTIDVRGMSRKIKPELCTASGKGIKRGTVGEQAKFIVHVPKEAGPGTLEVSATGPQSPEPIDIQNCDECDGTMQVTYHPTAPGEYTIGVLFGNLHIKGSPFSAHVTGHVVRNAKLVRASGTPLTGRLRCNQLGTITVRPGEGAGPGPLRAKLEGPLKAGLRLLGNADGTVRVTFTPKNPGNYNLHLLWGDRDEEIRGSPFSIKVVK